MIIAGVEFESEYLKWYYKWLEIVELKHSEEVFLLYLKDCFILTYSNEIEIFENSKLIYDEDLYHRIYFNNDQYIKVEYLISIGYKIIEQYENT